MLHTRMNVLWAKHKEAFLCDADGRRLGGVRSSIVVGTIKLGAFLLRRFEYRGYWRLCVFILSLMPEDSYCCVISDDIKFLFPTRSAYWARLIGPRFQYEPELASVLLYLADVEFLFLDGGANYGYWSAEVSGSRFGRKQVISIEAEAENCSWLRRNAEANESRFKVYHKALWNNAEEFLTISGSNHPSDYSVTRDQNDRSSIGNVQATTVDELVALENGRNLPVVLKLDIEGAEVQALEGARKTLKSQCLVLYEDHSADPEHKSTAWFLREGDYHVGFCGVAGITPVHSLEAVSAIKKASASNGCNFVAFRKASLWESLFQNRKLWLESDHD